jgi:hypothetical protein
MSTETETRQLLPEYIRNIGPVVAAIPRSGYSGEYAVVIKRPDLPLSRAYATQLVVRQLDGWVAVGNGNYDLAFEDAQLDMIKRSELYGVRVRQS